MNRARELSIRLAERAEEVCRVYLSNGRRSGSYWLAGDVRNAKGKSLWVRLRGSRDAVGRWRDEAEEGAFGDLLDLIRLSGDHAAMTDAMAEAERFLGMAPQPETAGSPVRASSDASESARRLFARGGNVTGTLGETYLRLRALTPPPHHAVRFHPNAMYLDDDGARRSGPALLAAIRNANGAITGVHRTWISVKRGEPVALLRKIIGRAREHAVHLGGEGAAALVGEGLETVWSLRGVLDEVRLCAALSAAKLALWRWPRDATRLYVAVDNDPNNAGADAAQRLIDRAAEAALPALPLYPRLGDFNDDLREDGEGAVKSRILRQISAKSAIECAGALGAVRHDDTP